MNQDPYRFFDVEVSAVTDLGPSFVRITFIGPDLHEFAELGPDQRIKVILPLAGSGYDNLPRTVDWYAVWRGLPVEQQNPFRTYTARAVRQSVGEVDVDFVRHGDTGPASTWAGAAKPGDRLVLLGPNALSPVNPGGAEWNPPVGLDRVLLVGDETAVPAIAGICSQLPTGVHGHVVLEVPQAGDIQDLSVPPMVDVSWLVRDVSPVGSKTISKIDEVAGAVVARSQRASVGGGVLVEEGPDDEVLWEVPEQTEGEFYAWIAGEAGVIKTVRRHLVQQLGVDRKSVAFMGYWRLGHAEG